MDEKEDIVDEKLMKSLILEDLEKPIFLYKSVAPFQKQKMIDRIEIVKEKLIKSLILEALEKPIFLYKGVRNNERAEN